MKTGRNSLAASAAAWMLGAWAASAQISAPLDVTVSSPVRNSNGSVLQGSNPSARKFGLTVHAGALVQVIDAGPNGRPDLPKRGGEPAGDDTLFATTVIGQGIAPNVPNSGQFAVSFYPPPPEGSRVYVRVFNAPTLAGATRWGQSNPHLVQGSAVFDASVLGLWATTQPLGTDPLTTDTDGDGVSDYEELLANTNADDSGDLLRAGGPVGRGAVTIDGRAGRRYHLLRSADDLTGQMEWVIVASSAVLTTNQTLQLSDPAPVDDPRVFYRVDVSIP